MTTKRSQGVNVQPNTFSESEKREIAAELKPISDADAIEDFGKLCEKDFAKLNLSCIGNKCVDRFTFCERLNTVGLRGFNFYDVLANKDKFILKLYVQSLLKYEIERGSSENKAWLYLSQLYFGSVAIFRPLVAANIYDRFKPKCVLDPTMGWGGRLIGAMAAGVPRYVGIDNNQRLEKPYTDMVNLLGPLSGTEIDLRFTDALTVDYSKISYDMVLTSPPYYNIEVYGGKESLHKSKADWNSEFYTPLFSATYKWLDIGGFYCINVPKAIYEAVCIPLLGEANYFVELQKVKRGSYCEFIYVWRKSQNRGAI